VSPRDRCRALAAPFPYFGGKGRIAGTIWQALGNPGNYVEPFAGSLATLLQRPDAPTTETVNDLDGLLVNAWRAIQADPASTAAAADYPVSELDLHARHLRMVAQRGDLTAKLTANPDYFDARLAGWWVWGACCWIGSGWCSGAGPWTLEEGRLVKGDRGQGIHKQLPHLGDRGRGIHKQLPHLGDRGRGVAAWFEALSTRLERVRIACGDWQRVLTPSVLERHGIAGVLLDPPYDPDAAGCHDPYAHGGEGGVSAKAAQWAFGHGDNPALRIVLCGYQGEHEPPTGWRAVQWKTRGGYGSQGAGRGRENACSERLWLSPHCLKTDAEAGYQPSLFGGAQ